MPAESSYVATIPSLSTIKALTLSSTLSFVKYKLLEPSDKLSVSNALIFTAISSVFTVIPVPAPIFSVLLAAIVPPPVKPEPANIDTPE